jgi:para-nitrobenzyl esterase
MGHLDLSSFDDEQFAVSGNVGLIDIVDGLRWIKENIAGFGGDPGNVTVFGESGGGAKTLSLLTMPSARGLIHKASPQSAPGSGFRTPESAARGAARVLSELGVGPGDWKTLQSLPARSIVAAAAATKSHWGPVIDGVTFTRPMPDEFAAGAGSNVPLLLGTTKHEAMTTFAGVPDLGDDFAALRTEEARSALGEHLEGILRGYRTANPNSSPGELAVAIETDRIFRVPALRLAEVRAATGAAATYVYRFDRINPLFPEAMAGHAADVAFWHDNVDVFGAQFGHLMFRTPKQIPSPDMQTLADQMCGALVRFAADGSPGPDWPPYDVRDRSTMLWDEVCRVVTDPDGDLRFFWDGVPVEASNNRDGDITIFARGLGADPRRTQLIIS